MNKIIAAFDSLKPSQSTIDYSKYLSRNCNAHIVAAFLEDMLYHEKVDDETWLSYEEKNPKYVETLIKEEEVTRTTSFKKVENIFNENGIHYNVHKDQPIALQSLVKESHFADLILIDADETFSNTDKSKPSEFLRDLLASSACPVLLVPKEFKPIEKVVFAYDGTPSSIYAIKLFTYLLNLTGYYEVEVIMISDEKHSNHLPHERLLKELLKRKYLTFTETMINSDHTVDALADYFRSQTANCIAILGSYQRSSFSRWLHRSTADALIPRLNIPLFIAHK